MTGASWELNFQGKHHLIFYVAKVKAATSANIMGDAALKPDENIIYTQIKRV